MIDCIKCPSISILLHDTSSFLFLRSLSRRQQARHESTSCAMSDERGLGGIRDCGSMIMASRWASTEMA